MLTPTLTPRPVERDQGGPKCEMVLVFVVDLVAEVGGVPHHQILLLQALLFGEELGKVRLRLADVPVAVVQLCFAVAERVLVVAGEIVAVVVVLAGDDLVADLPLRLEYSPAGLRLRGPASRRLTEDRGPV